MPDDESKERELRRHPRISWNFLVRHHPHDEGGDWAELSTVRNISIGGCYFGSSRTYPVGQVLDLQVKLPGVKDPLVFQGRVRRCDAGEGASVWFIAVEFMNMDTPQRDEFTRVISFFLKKQNQKK